MQTLRKKTSPCKYRNDPAKFFGDGVTFKAKLIGILEVGEARGDRMCQEALQDLKMAIRAAGEHKQRITIHVTIDGLRLRDEKTSDSLYHHPVHKISFIAQDMTDSRAFGYIFGSPDSGHRFFGIKTDKAASQVVLAMRDLFQVVFELKKKEIELARQHIQSKTVHDHTPVTFPVKSSILDVAGISSYSKKSTIEAIASKVMNKTTSPESVADLVDLEQELSSIQRGITQMERITPNEPTVKPDTEDPFGDSFTNFPTYNLLPPPESSKSRHSKPLKPPEEMSAPTETSTPTIVQPVTSTASGVNNDWLNATSSTPSASTFEESKILTTSNASIDESNFKSLEDMNITNGCSLTAMTSASSSTTSKYIDVFTDLDPLGTGKNKPYVDKKYFFHDLKNPPKKVLKDLSGKDEGFMANFSASPSVLNSSDDINDKNISKNNDKLCDIDLKLFENYVVTNLENDSENSTSLITSTTVTTSFSHNPLDEFPKKLPNDFQDPFTNSKIDPFMEDEEFSKVTLDPFDFSFNENRTSVLPETKITTSENESLSITATGNNKLNNPDDKNVFNGPLQVNLPPESWSSHVGQKKLERQQSETLNTSTTISSFSVSSTSAASTARNRPNVFKQNTVDVISSISSKKMKPHLFGQKFSKRDSNSINMRRLQESDSLSENEAAPEPPPRPETGSHIEPPPLPPKKQFSDIVIRPSPRVSNSSSSTRESTRYDFLSSTKFSKNQNENAPPLPLPSRKVGKTESSYPGPGRPLKKPLDDEDYLTPINKNNDLPILLPPPQQKIGSKTRQNRKIESSTCVEQQKIEIPYESATATRSRTVETSIPDITLSQLLTLGIDDLAKKLNVPISKLNTMTLVELTTYLSDFIEDSKNKKSEHVIPESQASSPAVFKVNFDQNNDSTFIAKFDDSFGDDTTFVANFDNFNSKSEPPTIVSNDNSTDGTMDRYAVFREIIDQEINNSSNENETFETPVGSLTMTEDDIKKLDEESKIKEQLPIPITKIDTKITEVISQAKDRYAALRDIVLVEDLFDKKSSSSQQNFIDSESTNNEEHDNRDDINENIQVDEIQTIAKNVDNVEPRRESNDISPEINIYLEPELQDIDKKSDRDTNLITNTLSTKDDLEIDKYMHRALSNLSLDSRDHLSPIDFKTSPVSQIQSQNASTSPIQIEQIKLSSLSIGAIDLINKTTLNDMSTSPIPIQKSPIIRSPILKSPASGHSPIPQISGGSSNMLAENQQETNTSNGASDGISGSSPEENNLEKTQDEPNEANNESWAVFDTPTEKIKQPPANIKSKSPNKDSGDSPCSSDGKEEWKSAQEYSRRWPNGQTSSSSRDVSPWDEDASDYRRRYNPTEKHGHHVRHTRRLNSCDEEHDDKLTRRREKRIKVPGTRSRENFESENWYHLNEHQNWSPPEDDDQECGHVFDRSSYERSTYGPPYEKRDHKNLPSFDRRDYKGYDKRKYYRDYTRPEYDFDPYRDNTEGKEHRGYYDEEYERRRVGRKDYPDEIFETSFDRESRDSRGSHKSNARDYFYERDKRSFDRESVESYESGGRARRSFGSGEIYGSLDSRGEFRGDVRHMTGEKNRSWRKGLRARLEDDHDSENDVTRRMPGDTRSLQRSMPGVTKPRKSSGSSPWDGEDLTPTSTTSKSWKRPTSASESERRLGENKRVLCNNLSGSDGEKERRFRKKTRSRSEKEPEPRPNYASLRYPRRRPDDYLDFDDSLSKIQTTRDPYFPENDDEVSPRAVDIGERQYYSRREQYFKNLTPRSETRTIVETLRSCPEIIAKQHQTSFGYDKESERKKISPRESYNFAGREKKLTQFDGSSKDRKNVRMEFQFDEFEDTPRSTTSSKFNFEEEQGFESDFNSPTVSGKTSGFRFSNDFSENETTPRISSEQTQPSQLKSNFQFESEFTSNSNNIVQSKLRFNDNVTISKFETDEIKGQMFEDDFSKAEFSFEDEDKWNELPNKKNFNKMNTKQYDNIKKSESVNIFAKKVDDPFEDDDFFQTNSGHLTSNNNININNNDKPVKSDPFQWEKNFAKFDDNM